MAGVLLMGMLGYSLLPISSLPPVDFPTIQVTAQFPGASPDVMVSSVTTPMERQFGQISGLSQMTSVSSFGNAGITLQFVLDRDIDAAAQDVQAAMNAANGVLPRMPNPPIYSKVNPADTPILTLRISSDSLPLEKVNDLADTVLAHDCGWVVEPGDSAGLRRVLAQLVADPGEVLRRRRNAWHAGQEIYDQSNLARPWIAVLESALTRDRG